MAKIDRHYQDELARLHEMAAEYAQLNPSQAGFLAGAGSDPDVERILEGVAFLTAGLRSELEKDQTQLLQNILQVASPDLLRPLPSVTLMQFSGRPALKELLTLPAGTPVAGLTPDFNRRCEFKTLTKLSLLPLTLKQTELRKSTEQEPGVQCLCLHFGFNFADYRAVAGRELPLYLSAPHGQAVKVLDALLRHCTDSTLVYSDGFQVSLATPQWDTHLMQWSFLPEDQPELPAQRLAQRFFMAPELTQGIRLRLPEAGEARSDTGFCLNFFLDGQANWPRGELKNLFRLNVVPAINLFERDAPPRVRDHRETYMALKPRQRDDEMLSVYGIAQVSGQFRSQPESHDYLPFWQQVSRRGFYYQEQLNAHPVTDELELSVALGGAVQTEQEVIKARLYCSNGDDATRLAPGQINTYISGSPELTHFENLTTPTPFRKALSSDQQYWQAVRQLSSNLMGHLTVARLQAALRELVLQASSDLARQQINMKQVASIQSLELKMVDRLVSAQSVRGYEVAISLAGDHFPDQSGMHLFARLLQQFFISLVPVNYFCLLKVTDRQTGEQIEWPPMLGRKPLL